MRSRTFMLAVLLSAAACSGPIVPIDVGIKELPTDIILGAQSTEGSPPAVAVLSEPIPVPVPPPPVRRSGPTSVPEPEEPCPQADPLGSPERELRAAQILPPEEATYPFGVTGSVKAGDLSLPLPPRVDRRISNVVAEASGAFSFVVAGVSFETHYRVVPRASDGQQAGLYMTRQIFRTSDPPRAFQPAPPIKLMPFPVENGASWDSVGTDPSTQTTWIIHGTVGVFVPPHPDAEDQSPILNPTIRVDACGEWLEGWAVRITGPNGEGASRIISPTMDLAFTATYAFATQYGSLSIFDETTLDGTVAGTPFLYESVSSIKAEPRIPEGG